MKYAVKYCGGCRSGYDRVSFAKALEKKIGERLETAATETEYDELYVICGCSARCADVSNLKSRRFTYIDFYDESII